MPWHRCRCRSTRQCSDTLRVRRSGQGSSQLSSGLSQRRSVELTATIDGVSKPASGDAFDVTMPSDHSHVLGHAANATQADATEAIDAALAAAPGWAELSFEQRAAVFLRAADLLAGPWRDTLNAATMLGQGKTVQQAEIDAACELIDFWRFNVAFARRIFEDQPISSPGVWNRADYRPLEGFVYAITPFNFTSIAGNLPTSPALHGERGDLEAEPDPAVCRAFHHAALGGGGPAARRDQHVAR